MRAWKGAALAALLVGGTAMAQTGPRVMVAQGALAGIADHGVQAYLDIPFAAPPIGALRFAPPAPPVAWIGARDAGKYGPACQQQATKPNGPWSAEFFADPPFNEDCLTLNVWTTGGRGKAVLLFIPGGGFTQGGGAESIYNGAGLAKQDVVMLTINYRLGAAGFLATPELSAASPRHASGNYALWDIVAALQWIKANIAAFGGDPAKVTIMGQSAGASAIVALLQAPQARGLFRGAIIDSGVRAGGGLTPAARAEETGSGWAKAHGANDVAALRALPTASLVPVSGEPYRFGPSADGALIPASSDPAIPAVDVPVMTGWNGGEGAGSGPQPNLTAADEAQRVTAMANDPGAAALYPAGADPVATLRAAGHDSTMISGAAWARARAAHAKSPVYYFDFEHVMPGYTAADWGAYHSSELPYVFGTLDRLAGRSFTETDTKAATVLQGYWLNFIKTGDPNGAGPDGGRLSVWRPFDPAHDEVMALGDAPHMRPIAAAEKAALWRNRLEKP
jgi:para-nitrobenzyl esterase